jgi:PKD repeat protein
VTDDSGLSSTASTAVNILNANPTADAGPDLTIDECQQSNNSYNCSFPITFNGAASDPGTADLLTYSWDFGDGSPLADGASATYIYPSLDGPKEYGVTLWVRDDDYNPNPLGGNEIGEAFDSLKLTVNNVSPWNVNAGGPYTGVETLPVNLTGTAEDAPADVPDLTYAWDLDSNPDFETSGSQVPYTWNAAGSYTVRLQVKDNDGGEGFASAQVTIQNALPHAQANGPYTTTVKMPLTLSSAGSSDPTNDPLTYGWDFGDGTPMVVTTSITVTHSYTDDGIYTATLKVDDSRGGTDLNSARVTVLNLPPTAVANANPTTVTKGNPVTFDGSGSTDPDDNPATLNYQWNFGDGGGANGINASHTYVNRGTYTATLIVTDDNGASSNASVVITVNNSPPIAQAGPPNQTVNEGGQLTFDGSGSSDPDNDPLAYQWNFGDGTPVANGVSVTHPYQDGPATYVVTLTVTDNDGSTATDTVQVTVNNVAPTVDAGPPSQTLNEGTPFTRAPPAASRRNGRCTVRCGISRSRASE